LGDHSPEDGEGDAGDAVLNLRRRLEMRALIALDGSSERAAAAVSSWAHAEGVEVRLLCVVQPKDVHETAAPSGFTHSLTPAGQPSGQMLNVQEPLPRLAEDRSQALARAASERTDYLEAVRARYLHGVPGEVEVRVAEDVAAAINRAAVEHEVDLIAMGTHGRSGIGRALLGSVAERVVRESSVPVLLVGPQAKLRDLADVSIVGTKA
jgi:nucleotide-binding universal stress UspA family protein